MSKVNDGGAAFPDPQQRVVPSGKGGTLKLDVGTSRGMSLRDWFAGQALCGMMACSYTVEHGDDPSNAEAESSDGSEE